jgi:hypothetical protein
MTTISFTIVTRLMSCSVFALATSICLSLAVGASPALAAKTIHHYSTARAEAPFVSPCPAPVYPAPADPLYAACGNMRIAFPACPGH